MNSRPTTYAYLVASRPRHKTRVKNSCARHLPAQEASAAPGNTAHPQKRTQQPALSTATTREHGGQAERNKQQMNEYE